MESKRKFKKSKTRREFDKKGTPSSLDTQNSTNPTPEPQDLGQSGSNPNDPSWYGRNKLLTQTLGLINFSEHKGTANHIVLQTTAYDGIHLSKTEIEDYHIYNRFPGIMIHDFTPTFGSLNTSGNDAEEMARMVYATIRRTISGRRNYDATAVLQYILAVGSLQSAFGELHRVLAAVRNRNLTNRYFGERLVEALGYQYDDIVANYNQYAFTMNQVALTAETLALPEGIKLFDKWYQLNSSVYADSDDPRSGLIAFVANGFWVWRNLNASGLNLDYIKAEVKANHAPELGSSVKSAGLAPGNDSDVGEFAPYGLILEEWPTYHTESQESPHGSRFSAILNTLRRAAFEYIDNHDFNLIAADLRKAYGDSVITARQFVPEAKLNITYDALMNASIKNITYAPFYPKAALEFPAQAWESKGHRNGLVYVIQNPSLATHHVLHNAAVKDRSGEIQYTSKLAAPQTSYVFSKWESLSPEETMDMLKWQIRYRVTRPNDGNVLIYRDSSAGLSIDAVQNVGLFIETMGTEVITSSRIFGIVDNLRGLGETTDGGAYTELTQKISTYGQLFYYFGVSNYVFIPRYHIPKVDADSSHLDEETRIRREYNSLVLSHNVMAFLSWARHWDSAPALYTLTPASLFDKKSGEKLYHWSDLMSLNPWPHYAVIDGNTLRRHHEVGLASLLGIGSWGPGTINSEQSRENGSLDQKGIQS